MPGYLTVEEAAEVLDYHPESVRQLIRDGKSRADKKGTMWLIYRESVEDFKGAIEGKAKRGRPKRNA